MVNTMRPRFQGVGESLSNEGPDGKLRCNHRMWLVSHSILIESVARLTFEPGCAAQLTGISAIESESRRAMNRISTSRRSPRFPAEKRWLQQCHSVIF